MYQNKPHSKNKKNRTFCHETKIKFLVTWCLHASYAMVPLQQMEKGYGKRQRGGIAKTGGGAAQKASVGMVPAGREDLIAERHSTSEYLLIVIALSTTVFIATALHWAHALSDTYQNPGGCNRPLVHLHL